MVVRKEKENARVGHVNSTLETVGEVSLSSSSGEDLSLDDKLVLLGT